MIKLAECSHKKFYDTFEEYVVERDFADPIYNYLVHGYSPGSFFTAILANDFRRAIQSSHPANSVLSMKALIGWMDDYMPRESYGSYVKVMSWTQILPEVRRNYLLSCNLIYSEKEETWRILKGDA